MSESSPPYGDDLRPELSDLERVIEQFRAFKSPWYRQVRIEQIRRARSNHFLLKPTFSAPLLVSEDGLDSTKSN